MARHRLLIVLAAVLVVAVGIGAPLWAHGRRSATAECPGFRVEAQQRAALVTGSGAPVLVIGDSYSAGFKVRADQSWPTYLPGRVDVDAFSGSGFSVDASPCGDVSYATRAEHSVGPRTGLVVVEGGLNDTDQPDAAVEAGFRRLMRVLAGHSVLVVGPPPAPLRLAGAVHVDALLARLSRAAGVPYLSMIHLSLPYLSDRLHLTPEGHRAFGDRVAESVGALA